ncbi:MAG TPA: hypothetical protein VF754_02460, partial [Pyrinomonadaceae bacterium]
MSRQTFNREKTTKPHETPAADASPAPPASAHALLEMQRAYGNRAVGRYLQAERNAGRSSEAHEQQADALSERLFSDGALPTGAITPLAQTQIQRQPLDDADPSVDIHVVAPPSPAAEGVESPAAEAAQPAAPEVAPAEKREEQPSDLNLPLDRLRRAVSEIGKYLQTT